MVLMGRFISQSSYSRLGQIVALAWLLTGCAAAVPIVADRVLELSEYIMTKDDPESLDPDLIARAGLAMADSRYAEAETYLNAALSVDTYDDRALRQLALLYRLTGRPAKAQSFEQMVRDIEMIDSGLWIIEDVVAPTPASVKNIQRFVALTRLFDAELITEDEYDDRREANLGLLLPLTKPTSSIDLERQPPRVRDIVERFNTINLFKQAGALDLVAYDLERNAILEGLMPLPQNKRHTIATVNPEALDPEAHQEWLDRLLATELITPREYNAESEVLIGLYSPAAGIDEGADTSTSSPLSMNDRPMTVMDEDAIAQVEALAEQAAMAMQVAALVSGVQNDAVEGDADTGGVTLAMAASVTRVNIHLALSRTPESAQRSWDELQQANGLALDGLIPRVSRVDLGGDKGIFFQLSAGPLADITSAEQVCDELLSRDYYCAPLIF